LLYAFLHFFVGCTGTFGSYSKSDDCEWVGESIKASGSFVSEKLAGMA